MNHTSHGSKPGGKGADSKDLPIMMGQAQLEQIQQRAWRSLCLAIRTEKWKGWQWTSGILKQADSAVGGDESIQGRHRCVGKQLLHEPSGRNVEHDHRESRNRPCYPTGTFSSCLFLTFSFIFCAILSSVIFYHFLPTPVICLKLACNQFSSQQTTCSFR